MKVQTHTDAECFLRNAQVELESNEAANSLMLGICGQLIRHPGRISATPCLKMVEDETGLILAAVMTVPHKLVVYGHEGDLDGGIRVLVQDLVGEGWTVPGVLGPSDVAKGIAKRWAEVTDGGFELESRQRVHELTEVIIPAPERGGLRLAREADVELVARWWYGFHHEIFREADRETAQLAAYQRIEEGDIYLWEDQGPVSIAMKTRPTRNGISVSLVYTPPELRGRGYATACVGELSRLLLESGYRFCALFADVSNTAANHIYQSIGYEPINEYAEYVFW
jgi:predicted GNAT family acetyltransferase